MTAKNNLLDKKLTRESIFIVGRVLSVEGRLVRVRVNKNKNHSHILYEGKTVKNVEKILDDPAHGQFSRMFEIAADRGYGKPVSAENVRERVKKTVEVIRAHCSAEQAAAILADMRPIWA